MQTCNGCDKEYNIKEGSLCYTCEVFFCENCMDNECDPPLEKLEGEMFCEGCLINCKCGACEDYSLNITHCACSVCEIGLCESCNSYSEKCVECGDSLCYGCIEDTENAECWCGKTICKFCLNDEDFHHSECTICNKIVCSECKDEFKFAAICDNCGVGCCDDCIEYMQKKYSCNCRDFDFAKHHCRDFTAPLVIDDVSYCHKCMDKDDLEERIIKTVGGDKITKEIVNKLRLKGCAELCNKGIDGFKSQFNINDGISVHELLHHENFNVMFMKESFLRFLIMACDGYLADESGVVSVNK
jgi:hypothetical protein